MNRDVTGSDSGFLADTIGRLEPALSSGRKATRAMIARESPAISTSPDTISQSEEQTGSDVRAALPREIRRAALAIRTNHLGCKGLIRNTGTRHCVSSAARNAETRQARGRSRRSQPAAAVQRSRLAAVSREFSRPKGNFLEPGGEKGVIGRIGFSRCSAMLKRAACRVAARTEFGAALVSRGKEIPAAESAVPD
jgi:hypothetical protein